MDLFRFRTGKRVFDEIVYLMNKYPGTNYFRPRDSITNGNIKELEILCDLLIENKVNIRWCMDNAAIRHEMRTPLYKKPKRAGCEMIDYGMETASSSLIVANGKRLAKGVDAEKIVREGSKAGIDMIVNFMFGLPGETDKDFEMQKEFLKRNRKYIYHTNPSVWLCYFPPGSLGYENPDEYGINVSLGSLFWESKDGKNNYLVRLERYLEFWELTKKLGLSTIYLNQPPIHNIHELKGDYYFLRGDFIKAKEEYTMSLTTASKNPDVNAKLLKCYNNLGMDARNLEPVDKKGLSEGELNYDLRSLREISDEIEELKKTLKFIETLANKPEMPPGINIISRLKYRIYFYLKKNILLHIIEPLYTRLVYRVISSLEVIDEQIKTIKR